MIARLWLCYCAVVWIYKSFKGRINCRKIFYSFLHVKRVCYAEKQGWKGRHSLSSVLFRHTGRFLLFPLFYYLLLTPVGVEGFLIFNKNWKDGRKSFAWTAVFCITSIFCPREGRMTRVQSGWNTFGVHLFSCSILQTISIACSPDNPC